MGNDTEIFYSDVEQKYLMSTRPVCPKCDVPLSGAIARNITTCLTCGSVWLLSNGYSEVIRPWKAEILKKKMQRLRLRWLNKLYANLFGYFWLPCPICGRDFGGHEWLPENVLIIDWADGKGVCPNCGEEAKRRNQEYMISHPFQTTR